MKRAPASSRRPKSSGLFVLVLIAILPACNSPAPTEAAAPIADSTMIQLLIELHLAEARSQILQTDETAVRDSIFTLYDIENDVFEAAMEYYADHPDAYVKIYSEALDKLSDERYLPAN